MKRDDDPGFLYKVAMFFENARNIGGIIVIIGLLIYWLYLTFS